MAPGKLKVAGPPSFDGAHFAPTGGTRVSLNELIAFRSEIENVANAAGWPASSLSAKQQLDRELIACLGSRKLPTGEMMRAEVWAWIAVRLVPHIVQWRFGTDDLSTSPTRFAGTMHRNALGRLWLRAWVFGGDDAGRPERWELAQALNEDTTVAILERTSVASDHRLARAIAACWKEQHDARVPELEAKLRQVMKRLRVLAVVRNTSVMTEDALATMVHDAFAANQDIAPLLHVPLNMSSEHA